MTTFFATGAYVGLVPVAPGTFGSLWAIPLLLAFSHWQVPAPVVVAAILVMIPLAIVICQRAGAEYADTDSGRIVLDEICGMLIAGALIVPTWVSLSIAFVAFRVFDIVKPFPARYFDREVRNGFGVVADDVVAGLYANVVVRMLT